MSIRLLIKGLLRAVDDLVLQRLIQIAEEIAVSRHPDDQVFIVLRMLLGIDEGLAVHHVKLV